MSPEMDQAAETLRDARNSYDNAESALAVARATLSRAEREFHDIWGKALMNREKYPPRTPQGSETPHE